MRNIAAFFLLLCCGAGLAIDVDRPTDNAANYFDNLPPGVRLFDLHDPKLMTAWPAFLATTPMLNEQLLPTSLQNRLANVVSTYRSLTPVDHPAFFVATYFDVLSERLLTTGDGDREILPMRVCPVFASGGDASVSSLLAVASGLPDALFVHAPGLADHYRYLFLQTEFSHCRFLASLQAAVASHSSPGAEQQSSSAAANLSFVVGGHNFTAAVRNKEELRALVETVGEVDAIAMFGDRVDGSAINETAVLNYIRLFSLLATDGRSGYAAIPVLFPELNKEASSDATSVVRIGDALDLAYATRDVFRQLVPLPIRDTDDLLRAKLTVAQALAEGGLLPMADERVASLLTQFVVGSDLLLLPTMAQ